MANPDSIKEYKWKPGQSGNPNGRPKGLSITRLVREELEKVPPGEKQEAKYLLVKKILHKALKEGDREMIKICWNYMDGMPLQKTDLAADVRMGLYDKDEYEELLEGERKALDEIFELGKKAGTNRETPKGTNVRSKRKS